MSTPAGLLEAFWAYDRALLTNDQAAMADLFAPGPDTLRGDGFHLLVGHDAITGFRSGRSVIPTRQVEDVHVRVAGPDTALVMARTRDRTGARFGLQTQLWQVGSDGRWRVVAAHVSSPVPSSPEPVWRVPGLSIAGSGGPLAGLRVAVKDLYAIAGQRIGAGVPAWLAEAAAEPEHAPVVASLLAAGAVVEGIAQTDEFAYSVAGVNAHYGASPNPAAPHATSGGSTSGPASAVALGEAEIGLGTDTAGSIRVPASYLGLVGLRTTHGALPLTGVHPLAPDFDAVGWVTRDVATSAAVARSLLPPDDVDFSRTLVFAGSVPASTLDAFDRVVSGLDLPPAEVMGFEQVERWFTAFRTWQGFQAWQVHGDWISKHPGALGPDVAARFEIASRITSSEASAASDVVSEARAELLGLLDSALLVLPATSGSAPPLSATPSQVDAVRGATLRLTCLASLAGAPAVSLPLLSLPDAWSGEPQPLGLSLVSAPGTDQSLLRVAERVLS